MRPMELVGRLTFSSLFITSGLVRACLWMDGGIPGICVSLCLCPSARMYNVTLMQMKLHVTLMQMKLQSYEVETGGKLMESVAPKLDTAIETLSEIIPNFPVSGNDLRVRFPYLVFSVSGLLLVQIMVSMYSGDG